MINWKKCKEVLNFLGDNIWYQRFYVGKNNKNVFENSPYCKKIVLTHYKLFKMICTNKHIK